MMENFADATHPLKVILQLHLATDTAAAQNLPFVLDALSVECLTPSTHLPKWTARINSLIHSKQVHARWAGLCLAHKSSLYSKALMIDNAQSWLGVAVPNLSRKETAQVLSASLNLCRIIFCSAADVPEFQRQVCTPNVLKFTAAIIALLENGGCDREFKVLLLKTLIKVISVYPTLHRLSHTSLSKLSLKLLDGSAPSPTHPDILLAASRLYATLPVTGGKVGATNLWKKSVEDTLAFGWNALSFIQNALTQAGNTSPLEHPQIAIPLELDRLRCCIVVLNDLFGSDIQRPVQLPIGAINAFALALLTLNKDDRKGATYIDINTRIIALSIVPSVWQHGCALVASLANHVRHHITPHAPRLVNCLSYHLERKDTYSKRLPYLTAMEAVLTNSLPLHSDVTCNRIARATVSLISVILPSQSEVESKDGPNTVKTKKKKRKAGGFEGDEVFKTSRDLLFPSIEDGEVVLTSCRVLQLVLRNTGVNPATHSLSFRAILSILLFLPQRSPSSISPDVSLHDKLLLQIQAMGAGLGSGTTNTLSKGLAVVLRAGMLSGQPCDKTFDLLIHPRVPPLVRSMPHVETLSLFHAEESTEEASIRESLGLMTLPPPTATDTWVPVVSTSDAPTVTPAVAHVPTTTPAPQTFMPVVPVPSDAPMADVSPSFKPVPPSKPVYAPQASRPAVTAPLEEDEEDEEMPDINMDSDSD